MKIGISAEEERLVDHMTEQIIEFFCTADVTAELAVVTLDNARNTVNTLAGSMKMTRIREILKEETKKAGLSRRELALRSKVTENSIYRYERKNRIPDLETAGRIASALGCPIDDLVDKSRKEDERA